MISTRSARVNAALSICSAAASTAPVKRRRVPRGAARRASRTALARSSRDGPRIGAPLLVSSAQASCSGLAGRVAFCAAASCAGVGVAPSTHDEIVGGPLAQLGGALRPRCDRSPGRCRRARPCPVCGSTGAHSKPIDDAIRGAAWPGRSPRRPWLRDTATCRRSTPASRRRGAGGWARSRGCAGADPQPGGFRADRHRHQTRQPHKVFHPLTGCARGCSRRARQILHRLDDRGGMRIDDRLVRRRHHRAPPAPATPTWAHKTSNQTHAPRAHPTRDHTHH